MIGSLVTPFPRSYWVIPEKLLAGCYPGSKAPKEALANLSGLVDCGIGRIINLMEEDEHDWNGEPFAPYEALFVSLAADKGLDASCVRMPIKDLNVPSRETMESILVEIDLSLVQGRSVYIHCWGGRGRTGTVVGCYLARHGIAKGGHALRMIETLRLKVPDAHKASPETREQRDMVINWQKGE
jgi:hypothetical protein